MARHVLFKIVQQKPLEIDLSLEQQRKYPVHSHFLTQAVETVLIYKYKPDKKLDEKKYIDFLKSYLKKKYNAYSVIEGSLQEQLK
jgi:hypothetical protein